MSEKAVEKYYNTLKTLTVNIKRFGFGVICEYPDKEIFLKDFCSSEKIMQYYLQIKKYVSTSEIKEKTKDLLNLSCAIVDDFIKEKYPKQHKNISSEQLSAIMLLSASFKKDDFEKYLDQVINATNIQKEVYTIIFENLNKLKPGESFLVEEYNKNIELYKNKSKDLSPDLEERINKISKSISFDELKNNIKNKITETINETVIKPSEKLIKSNKIRL